MKTENKPFTKEEQEIIDLLTEAHNKFVLLPKTHPDDTIHWRVGIHKCQGVLMGRVVRRDYPDTFYSDVK